jgi:hypothetical protein
MKKKLLCALLALFSLNCVNAQVISKGDRIITAGIGFGSYLGGRDYSITVSPIGASFEYCVIDNLFDENSAIGVGGYLGYTAKKWSNRMDVEEAEAMEVKYTYTSIAAKGYFHYNFVPDLDTYGGLALGYNIVGRKATPSDYLHSTSSSGVGFSLFVGARYYFSSSIGAYAEIGYGIAALELGLSIKL